jgi:hypothetical protein
MLRTPDRGIQTDILTIPGFKTTFAPTTYHKSFVMCFRDLDRVSLGSCAPYLQMHQGVCWRIVMLLYIEVWLTRNDRNNRSGRAGSASRGSNSASSALCARHAEHVRILPAGTLNCSFKFNLCCASKKHVQYIEIFGSKCPI